MWQMIIGFLYRKSILENNHNYLPHCPIQKGGGAYDCVAPCDPISKIYRKEPKAMKNKFFYGTKPHINNYDPRDFSHGDYE